MYFDPVETGKRIKELRNLGGYTQIEFAEKLNVSRAHYGKIEIGLKTPSIDLLIEIAEISGVTLDYLILGRKQPMEKAKLELQSLITSLTALEKAL